MSESQRALDELELAIKYPNSKYNDSRLIEMHINTLNKLVQLDKSKEVLIKQKEESSIKYYYCPNCQKLITINSSKIDYLEGNFFCKNCGQRLGGNKE